MIERSQAHLCIAQALVFTRTYELSKVRTMRTQALLAMTAACLLSVSCATSAHSQSATTLPELGPDIEVKDVAKAIADDSKTDDGLTRKKIAQADASTSGASTDNTSAASSSPPLTGARRIGHILKSNIVETFQLDPRLQKDLTDSPVVLSPIRLVQDNFAIGYNPSIQWEKSPGADKWPTTYNKRNLALYWVGPVTKHQSIWAQMTPASGAHGFCQNWEMLQGTFNYGSDKNFLHGRGGIMFNWQNAGFAGADRSITQTSPGVYTAFNGFDPTANSRGFSLEATGLNWTTAKAFTYFQQPPTQTSSDPNINFTRSYGGGFAVEKLLGKEGISGFQSNLTLGSTNLWNGNTSTASQVAQYNASQAAQYQVNSFNTNLQAQADAQVAADLANGLTQDQANADAQTLIANAGGFQDPVAAGQAASAGLPSVPIGNQTSPFVWWTSWINKSFQDKEGYIRLNPSFGFTTFETKRYYDDSAIPENRSKGYGYTFDVMSVPVRSYWTTILRMDAFNKSDLVHRNTQYTFTVGNAWDFHCGNKSKIRLTLDYQLIGQQGSTADQRIILGFWPIW